MISYGICLHRPYFTSYDHLWFHPRCCQWHQSFFFMTESYSCVCVCVCVCTNTRTYSSSIYLFIDTCIASVSWLLGKVLREHWGTCVFLNYGFVWIYGRAPLLKLFSLWPPLFSRNHSRHSGHFINIL